MTLSKPRLSATAYNRPDAQQAHEPHAAQPEVDALVDTLFEAECAETPSPRAAGGQLCSILEAAPAMSALIATGLEHETSYVWDLVTDKIAWEANAAEVLKFHDAKALDSGDSFQAYLVPEHLKRRKQAIFSAQMSAGERSAPYNVSYRIRPNGPRSSEVLWVEDHGRCWLDETGHPVRARGVIRRINDHYVREQSRQNFSEFDELTGQLNRIKLVEAVDVGIQRAKRNGETSAFLVAAINNLSVINETFGFHVGDELIRETAAIIRAHVRGGDTMGRYASNKFGILLNNCSAGAMRLAAERFMKVVRSAKINTNACTLATTVSVGGILIPQYAATTMGATSGALQALDNARHKHGDAFCAFTPAETQDSVRRQNAKIADAIMQALADNRFHICLQPIINAQSGEPELYECLLRLENRDGSLMAASEFVPVAERLGLARLLDIRTLELAIPLLREHGDLTLAVNVSAQTTIDDAWLITFRNQTDGNRNICKRLIVEITESAAIDDLDRTKQFADTLREFGCRIAMDDFGAGYTSFRNLKYLPCDIVKIDGMFVKNLAEDRSDQVFIEMMVNLASAMGMKTVAEWVGDDGVAQLLREAGITYLQGFHYGQPLTVQEYESTKRS